MQMPTHLGDPRGLGAAAEREHLQQRGADRASVHPDGPHAVQRAGEGQPTGDLGSGLIQIGQHLRVRTQIAHHLPAGVQVEDGLGFVRLPGLQAQPFGGE